jgi:LacI family transcriptional regulator
MAAVRDVAELANVSLWTVSKVVNGKASVRPKLAQVVPAAMEALGYNSNQAACRLKVRQTQTMGAPVSDVTRPFFTGVRRGMEGGARTHDAAVIFCASPDREQQVMEISLRVPVTARWSFSVRTARPAVNYLR